MESHNKTFVGYLLPTIAGLLYFGAKEEILMFIIFASLVLLGFYLTIFGMIEFEKDRHKIATKLRDGDYQIIGLPIVEIRERKESFFLQHFEIIDKFDFQRAADSIAVHLYLRSPYTDGPMRHYIILSEKIPAKLWPMLLSGSVIKISDSFVREIYIPGEGK